MRARAYLNWYTDWNVLKLWFPEWFPEVLKIPETFNSTKEQLLFVGLLN